MRIRLAAEDRARYEGCPEWLPWNPAQASIIELIKIQQYTIDAPGCGPNGLGPSAWRAALREPEPSAIVFKLVVWLALNRAGLQIGWTDVEFDWVALETAEDEDAGQGKEPSPTPPPPSKAESTG